MKRLLTWLRGMADRRLHADLCRRGYHWPETVWLECEPVGVPDECRFDGHSLYMRCERCGKVCGPMSGDGGTLATPSNIPGNWKPSTARWTPEPWSAR